MNNGKNLCFFLKLHARHYLMFGALAFFLVLAVLGMSSAVGLIYVYRTQTSAILGSVVWLASLAMLYAILCVLRREVRKFFYVKTIEFFPDQTVCILMKTGKKFCYSGPDAVRIKHNLSDGTYAIDLMGSPRFYIHELDIDNPSAFSVFFSGYGKTKKGETLDCHMDSKRKGLGSTCEETLPPAQKDGSADHDSTRQSSPNVGCLVESFRVMLAMAVFACPGIAVGVYEISHRLFGTREVALPYFVGVGFCIPAAFLLRLWIRSYSSGKI